MDSWPSSALMSTRPTDLLQDSTKRRTTRTEPHSALHFTVWITDRHSPTKTPTNTGTYSNPPSPISIVRLRLRAPRARTAVVLSRGAGRAQGGAGCPARAWRSGASLRPPRPCPRLRRRAVLVAMRLRARCGARRSGSRRVFRAGVWGGVVASFSVVGSRALVVSRGSLVSPLSAPWWRRLVGFALAAGACRWRLRRSVRSFAGAVVVAGFSSSAAASAFASAWSGWVGFPLAVRRFAGAAGPVWGVSVPPSVRLSPPPALPAPVAWARAA
jgi:hypothetical protein